MHSHHLENFRVACLIEVWSEQELNPGPLDKLKLDFFQFLVGRLLEHISQVHFDSRAMIVTYLVSKVTLVTFAKPLHFHTRDADLQEKLKPFENLAQFEPKVQVLDILGPAGRR